MLPQTTSQVTGYPLVTLVDKDGYRVPLVERDIDPDDTPSPWRSWPNWTECVRVHVGRRDNDVYAFGVMAGDIAGSFLDRADEAVPDDDPGADPDDFDRAMDALDDETPLPEPPDDWKGSAAAGWAMLAPISGGAPLDGDTRDYLDWLDAVDQPYPPLDQVASDWPRKKTMADVRADMADVHEFYATHPGA